MDVAQTCDSIVVVSTERERGLYELLISRVQDSVFRKRKSEA
jgi:hypothetical protein